jgi:hypothetical protein
MLQNVRVPVLLALVLLAGCSTSSFQMVPMPDTTVPLDNEEMARIYVIRGGGPFAENQKLFVADNDRIIGALGRDHYLVWDRPALITQLRYYLDSGTRPSGETQGNHRLIPEPGETYYLEVSFPLGAGRMVTKVLMKQYGRYLISEMQPAPMEHAEKQ